MPGRNLRPEKRRCSHTPSAGSSSHQSQYGGGARDPPAQPTSGSQGLEAEVKGDRLCGLTLVAAVAVNDSPDEHVKRK